MISSRRKYEDDSNTKFKIPDWGRYENEAEAVETLQRDSRRCNGNRFRRDYKSIDGIKTCILSNGSAHSWPDNCYDKIWVGVHGKESVCVVILKEDVDITRVTPFYQKCTNDLIMNRYAEAIISEVECMPLGDEFRGRFGSSIEKPFSVVSVIPCNVHEGSGNEASSAKHDEEKAIDFLMDKMKSNLAFTFEETVETAIAAFQHLCGKELKAEDIWVSTTWNLEGGTEDMKLPERKEYLDIISGASSGEGRLPKVPPKCGGTPAGEHIGKGLFVTVSPLTNLFGAYNRLSYSGERPCSTRGGGCCSSSDEEDDSKKNTVPNTGGSPPPAFM